MSIEIENFKRNLMEDFNNKESKIRYIMVPRIKDVETSGKYLLRRRFYHSKFDLGITVEWTQSGDQFRFKFVEEASVYEPIFLKQLNLVSKKGLSCEKHYEDYIHIGTESIEFGCHTMYFSLNGNNRIIPCIEPRVPEETVVLKKDGYFDALNAAQPRDFIALSGKKKKELDAVYHHYTVTLSDLDKLKKIKWDLVPYSEDNIKYLKKLFKQTQEGLYKTYVPSRILSALDFARLTRGM